MRRFVLVAVVGAGGPRAPRRTGCDPPPLPEMLAFGVWNARVWILGCSRLGCGVQGVGGEEGPLRDICRARNEDRNEVLVTGPNPKPEHLSP